MVGNDTLYKYGTEQIPSFSKWGVGGTCGNGITLGAVRVLST